MTTHGDLNASNVIGPVPMLVDWEYAQLADPVYDLACLSVYYPGLRLRGGELLGTAGITDANGAVRLRLHAQLFDSLNRLWEQSVLHGGRRNNSVGVSSTPSAWT
jgi:aminoglycoside phosphotransferase (APT) family kinase protein